MNTGAVLRYPTGDRHASIGAEVVYESLDLNHLEFFLGFFFFLTAFIVL